jgi:hypothetical protein
LRFEVVLVKAAASILRVGVWSVVFSVAAVLVVWVLAVLAVKAVATVAILCWLYNADDGSMMAVAESVTVKAVERATAAAATG